MRDLSGIIRRRAKEEIAVADKREHDKHPGVPRDTVLVDDKVIADRMAEYLRLPSASVRKQLARYMKDHEWRADYLQAFARSVGIDPAEMVWLDRKPDISEAHRAELLLAAVADRLELGEVRKFARLMQQLLDSRERFDLVLELGEAVLEAPNGDAAYKTVSRIVADTKAFEPKRRDLRRKPRAGQKV